MSRTYEDPCGTARALDRLGERWALLVVRELLFGPRRFGEIRAGLRGISPNVLTQRLEELTRDGIVEREDEHYRLTPRGAELEDVLLALARWGSRAPRPQGGELSAAALFLAFQTTYVPVDAPLEVEIRSGAEAYRVQLDPSFVKVTREPAKRPACVITTDIPTLRRLCFGDVTLDAVQVEGRRDAAQRFASAFRRPKIVTQ